MYSFYRHIGDWLSWQSLVSKVVAGEESKWALFGASRRGSERSLLWHKGLIPVLDSEKPPQNQAEICKDCSQMLQRLVCCRKPCLRPKWTCSSWKCFAKNHHPKQKRNLNAERIWKYWWYEFSGETLNTRMARTTAHSCFFPEVRLKNGEARWTLLVEKTWKDDVRKVSRAPCVFSHHIYDDIFSIFKIPTA